MNEQAQNAQLDTILNITAIDWKNVANNLQDRGYTIIDGFLTDKQCDQLTQKFDKSEAFRKTVIMERYRFGSGIYKYWSYPLPEIVQAMREELYPHLVPVANHWMELLHLEQRFPETLQALQKRCLDKGQGKPTPLILKYVEGGFNTLHQDLYGEVYFPIQAACILSRPNHDYTGGEFVLTQQTPRAQSKAIVLTPNLGDLVIFATNFRPIKGSRGYFRATMKHGVSEVRSGQRFAMGIIFHDAES